MAVLSSRRRLLTAASLAALLAVVAVVLATSGFDGGWVAGADEDPLVGHDYYASPAAVCKLLSAEDLELALGAAYEEGVEPGGMTYSFAGLPGVTKCFYAPEQQEHGSVELGVVYAYADQVFREHVERRGEERIRQLSGPGDRAAWDEAAHELLVLADDKVIAVSVPTTSSWHEGDLLERTRRLAEKAVGRLR